MGLYSLRVIEVSEAETRTMKSPSVSSSDDVQGMEIIFFLEHANRGWNKNFSSVSSDLKSLRGTQHEDSLTVDGFSIAPARSSLS
jgi:hypothetical protein